MSHEIDGMLTSLLPNMRRWALGLTRDRTAADDLTQDVAAKVLAARGAFSPGTNFAAWVRRIMVNHFISGMRSRREFPQGEDIPDIAVPAAHEDRIALRELSWAFDRLPAEQRRALSMVALEDRGYEAASEETGEAIGTLKSRVHRARMQLRSHMTGERPLLAA